MLWHAAVTDTRCSEAANPILIIYWKIYEWLSFIALKSRFFCKIHAELKHKRCENVKTLNSIDRFIQLNSDCSICEDCTFNTTRQITISLSLHFRFWKFECVVIFDSYDESLKTILKHFCVMLWRSMIAIDSSSSIFDTTREITNSRAISRSFKESWKSDLCNERKRTRFYVCEAFSIVKLFVCRAFNVKHLNIKHV